MSLEDQNEEQFIRHHEETCINYKSRFHDFNLCIRDFPEDDIGGIVLEIFDEMGIVKHFKIKRAVLVRFIMSVQQKYGNVPYHNWYHAVSVSHFAYLLITNLKLVERKHLSKLEAFALVVSALTHDIDHRGTNNQFQSYVNSDIYKLYATEESVMERHHLDIALAILRREDCNILESFNDRDYKYFVDLLSWNIIATDISIHLKTRKTLFADASTKWCPRRRKMARLSLFMTAADLCDSCKGWDDSLPTVKAVLKEFFTQGDMEKQLGITPLTMMDRDVAYIPQVEYEFTTYIVGPVYKFLAELYGKFKPCADAVLRQQELWAAATYVFDSYKEETPPLEILDLPEMKEESLMQLVGDESLDELRKRKFPQFRPVETGPTRGKWRAVIRRWFKC